MRFAKPDVGQRIKVVIPHHGPVHPGYYIPPTQIKGEVVSGEKFDDPLSFRMTTGKSYHPIAVIALNRISSLEYVDGTEAEMVEEVKPKVQTIIVSGSTGSNYVVTVNERGGYSCSCKGFGFRKVCKHVNQVKAELEGTK